MNSYIVITPFFPSFESFRGSYLLDQAKAIQSNSNYKLLVIILSPFLEKSQGDYIIEGVHCKTFRVIDFPSFIFPSFFDKINLKRFSKFLKKNKIKVCSESIIHGHINYPSLNFLDFFSRKFSCKTILQHHGLDILQNNTGITIPFIKWIQNKLILKRFNRLSEHITTHIAVSSVVKSNLIKINTRLENKIYVCVNGVDTTKFYVNPSKTMNDTKFVIGCVANFWELKDQMTLLKAVDVLKTKGIKNLHLKFVGSGKTLNRCVDYATKNNIDCEFINELKHTDLLTFYNQLNLFVLPSKYEAFGCVYLEALACGVPFIGVKNQGVEDVVKNELKKYQLVEAGSYDDLSKLIYYFYSNELTIRFDKAYTIENTIKKMLNHIIAQ
ncbi:MAG: glycosyltransferase family 4 protein [Flavobacteriales bacterium]